MARANGKLEADVFCSLLIVSCMRAEVCAMLSFATCRTYLSVIHSKNLPNCKRPLASGYFNEWAENLTTGHLLELSMSNNQSKA